MIKNYEITDKELLGSNGFIRLFKALVILAILLRNYLLKLMLFLASYIIPKNRKLLFFSSVGNYNFPLWANEEDYQFKESPKYLAIYSAKKLKSFITVFHVPNKKLFRKIEDLGIKPTKGLRAFWYMLRARYLFVDNNNFFNPNASFLVGNFKIIQCCHGTPLKNIEKKKMKALKEKINGKLKQIELGKFECIISACEYASKISRRYYNNTKVLELGYPRNDIFFERLFFEIENLSNRLKIDKFAKVLLYAPTFRKLERSVNPFDDRFLNRINETLKRENYLLLVKQHPYAESLKFGKNYSNIIDVSAEADDIQELLVNVDVLISDYSGSVFDFALTGKFQLFYPFDIEEYKQSRGDFYFEYSEENLPGLIITDKDDFTQKVEQLEALMEDKNIKDRIKGFKNKFNHYIDGNSCRRIFECLKLT